MRFMMLIKHSPDEPDWDALSEAGQQEVVAGWQAINETPGVTPGQQLQPPDAATLVRVESGQTVTTAGSGTLDGYFFVEADDLHAAVEIAARVPALSTGGSVEIRPVVEY